MRPVRRGQDPGGYSEYGAAYPSLVTSIGRYCSFCEAPLKNGQVEHVLPKEEYPHLRLSWSNFLLACLNCNATKGVWPKVEFGGRQVAFWPDTDNTARAFEYHLHQSPRPAGTLADADRARAAELLSRTGVDRSPAHPRWSNKDDRWELRYEAWEQATECLSDLTQEDTQIHRKRIAQLAGKCGFWSVWRAVFAADVDMLRRFNLAFVGTSIDCFDADAQSLARPGGHL